jgi:glutaryl-CoA transferase
VLENSRVEGVNASAIAKGNPDMSVFSGIHVLDLSRVLAGPYCGQMLADFGADVIKVEGIHGDENRKWVPVVNGRSANYTSVNRGKRNLTLNLKDPEAQEILKALVKKADVVIESFLPPVARRLGVDYETLKKINPDIIQVTISGYGDKGPLSEKPGYDLMMQAFSGMMDMTGDRAGGPVRLGPSLIDMTTGLIGFSGVASALYARAAGKATGQHVRVSLLETAIALLGYHVPAYTMAGAEPTREGSGVWHIVPYQAFETSDSNILAGATNDATWQRLCDAIGARDLAENPDYTTIDGRVRHRDRIIAALSEIFKHRTTDEWVGLLDAAKVPCSPVNTLAQTLAHPQVAALEILRDAADRKGGSLRLIGPPLTLSETPATPGGAPPDLGEHSDTILREELGFDDADIARLRKKGTI